MKPILEFWYEFASTYSYPAALRAEAVAQRFDVDIDWKPFLLGPIFKDLGWTTSPFNLQPAKGTYMWRDLERICAKLEVPFTKPDPFPQNGLHAARIAMALPDDGRRSAFSRAVYHCQFAGHGMISDLEQLKALLAEFGHDPDHVVQISKTENNKLALKNSTNLARDHGIFGAPTWRTTDGELFWGNDRLEDALEWVANPAR